MYSPRGVVDLALSDDDLPGLARRGNAMRLAGIDAEPSNAAALERFCPELGVAERGAFRSWVHSCSAAAARYATMRSPRDTRAPRPHSAWTSSRTAR